MAHSIQTRNKFTMPTGRADRLAVSSGLKRIGNMEGKAEVYRLLPGIAE